MSARKELGDGKLEVEINDLPDGRLQVRMTWPALDGEKWPSRGEMNIGPQDAEALVYALAAKLGLDMRGT